jgi:hypothetical protein
MLAYYLGLYLGYPECCAKSFIDTMGAVNNKLGGEVSDGTGFIPCPQCAQRVKDQEIKLEDLIGIRHHSLPFPEENFEEISRFCDEVEKILK